MTRVAILGYGAMGKEVERLAPSLGCEIVYIYDVEQPINELSPTDFDVAIDFTVPDAVMPNIETLCALKRPIVIGTTGWYQHMHDVRAKIHDADTGCVWGSNFSLGTHLFFRLVRNAATLVNGNSDFDIMVHEYHHSRKVDSPSGTAHTIVYDIMQRVDRKTAIVTETQHQRIDPHALHVTSTRGGSIVGKHIVTLDSPFENIEIIHNAKNRSGFAQGALLAAAWIAARKGCYDVTEIIDDLEALYRSRQA